MIHRHRPDLLAVALLIALPLLWFGPVLGASQTLLPVDNLFQYEPWRSHAAKQGVSVPHNTLLSDLILQNYVWKQLIRDSIAQGEWPLWNPYVFTGVPFLAAGQHSALYPFSILYYILPLSMAYGWFAAMQLALAGIGMYLFLRVLRRSPWASLFGAYAYAFGGFFIVSVVFPMIIAAAAWLPWLLAVIEIIVRKQEEKGALRFSPAPYVCAGAVFLIVAVLAGHAEILYYIFLVSGFYSAWRLIGLWWRLGSLAPSLRLGGWLLGMVALGMAGGAVQLVPLYELVSINFREGTSSLQEVRNWAWPLRHAITFVIPDFYGNPSHHGYWDIWTRSWQPATVNVLGEPIDRIFWGIKNYVEGGNYLGLLTLTFAVLGLLGWLSSRLRARNQGRSKASLSAAPFFAVLAALSLLFAFGAPLYALLYYGLPGWSQLHSPFRWVFPYTLCMAGLAAYGIDYVREGQLPRRLLALLGAGALAVAALTLTVLALSIAQPGPFVAWGERVLAGSDLARSGFRDGAMFWSYQWTNFLKFAVVLAGVGVVCLWGLRRVHGRVPRWALAAVALLVVDQWLIGRDFNPSVDARLLQYEPPTAQFLQQAMAGDEGGPWRLTTFNAGDEKPLNANSPMIFRLQDIRGYDSIIPKQYVEYMQRIEHQYELPFNRIAPLVQSDSLDSPWLHLAGVRYVATEGHIEHPGYSLVYDDELRIYRNERALPRAFVVPAAIVAGDDWARALADADLRSVVAIDRPHPGAQMPAIEGAPGEAHVRDYGSNTVLVDVRLDAPGWLVLTDAYFPGWRAHQRPRGGTELAETPLDVVRANGNFRAVYLREAGEWTVRFRYAPRSFQFGLYTSFLAAMTLLLLAAWWAWGRYYREVASDEEGAEVRTVAKNSLVPVSMSLLNRGIDFAFAMLRLRILSPAGEGSYAFTIAFYGLFEILVRFGLGTLLTRDVAADKSQASRYFTNVVLLRSLLWLVSLPVMGVVMLGYARWGGLTQEEAYAIGLFALALFFANLADSITAVFNAYEKMEFPAGVAAVVALVKVALGAVVLLLGGGFVGLAGVSVVMNIAQTIWLYTVLRRVLLTPQIEVDVGLQRSMLLSAGPLMLNHLLATIFWRIDLWILKPLAGEFVVGIYSAGVKYLDGLNVIPSYFTLAIFPLLSRYARASRGRDELYRAYSLAVRLMFITAMFIAVAVTFTATPLILILGGNEFLPDSAVALVLLIWSIPIGFVNSVTQYALIAVNQQRFLTKAFLIGVTVNVVGNILFIPMYGFRAAAVVTILSEVALFIPFYMAVRRHIGALPWPRLLWRPLLAAATMAGIIASAQPLLGLLGALTFGCLGYGGTLWLTGAFHDTDMDVIWRALRRRRLGVSSQ